MVWICLRYGVNFPYWDQWQTPGGLFYKISANQTIPWSDWIAQHNESRKLFPKLIFVGLASLTDWNIKVELMLNCLLNTVSLIGLYWLGTKTIKDRNHLKICLILSSILLFSVVQYENYLWGIQICVFLSIAAFVLCLGVLQENLSLPVKAILGAILCTISTFSFANGILTWVIVIPALMIGDRFSLVEVRKRWPWLVVWLGLMGVNLWVYFHDYVKPGSHPAFSAALENPSHAILYFRIFFGSLFGDFQKVRAMIVGETILVLWLVCLGMIAYRSFRDEEILPQTKSWILLGGYSIASGLITTLGRVGFGVNGALAPRYTSFSVWLYISLIFLIAIVLQEFRFNRLYSRIFKGIICGLIGLGLILHIPTSQQALKKIQSDRVSKLQGRACAVLSPAIEDADCLTTLVFPSLQLIKPILVSVNDLGYLHPPLIETTEIERFAVLDFNPEAVGYFNELSPISETDYQIRTWAKLPERDEPADAILLTYQGEQTPPQIFHRVQRVTMPEDVTADLPSFWRWGWEGEFERSKLPPGEWTIKAWAFDAIEGKAFELSGQFSLIV